MGVPARLSRLGAEWPAHRAAVFGVAYRLFGTVADAEDVVQDVWLKAAQADLSQVRDLRAWLVTVAARRSYDLLTSARARHEHYVGPWLPEPLLTGPDAAQPVLTDDTLTTAMLVVLRELSPPERVAVVLHHAFSVPYDEIAAVLERSEAACRQLVSRGTRKLRAARPPAASRAEKARLLAAFRAARESGDLETLVAVLAPDVVYTTDGGGRISAARNLIVGARRVARVVLAVAARHGAYHHVPAEINGEPGVLLYRDGRLAGVLTIEVSDGLITELRSQLNPDKLVTAGPVASSP